MTWTVDHPHRRTMLHHGERVHRVRVYRPLGVAGMGVLAALLGAWAAIVGFVGPEFGYQATNNSSWQWTTANWLLHLIPGGVAFVAGLAVLALAGASTLGARSLIRLAALAIVAAGAWLVIGPALWPVFESGSPYGSAATAQTAFTNQIGANLGPGLLLVALGAMIYEAISASRLAPAHEGPAGAVESPAGAVESPAGAVESPAGAVGSPAGAVAAPAAAMESPTAAMQSQPAVAEGPTREVESPAGAVENPAGAGESPAGARDPSAPSRVQPAPSRVQPAPSRTEPGKSSAPRAQPRVQAQPSGRPVPSRTKRKLHRESGRRPRRDAYPAWSKTAKPC